MIPLLHDLSGKTVVVVGGGSVALRKATLFSSSSEADVRVVADSFDDGFDDVDCEKVEEEVSRDNIAEYVDDAYLVVPATSDDSVNDAVVEVASEKDCLVNTTHEKGDVATPSVVETDESVVGISTHGGSPAMTKYLRRRIEPVLEEADPMVRLQKEIRPVLKDEVDGHRERRRLLWDVIEDDQVWEALEEGDYDEALKKASEVTGVELSRGSHDGTV